MVLPNKGQFVTVLGVRGGCMDVVRWWYVCTTTTTYYFCISLEATGLFQMRDKILTIYSVAESSTLFNFYGGFNLGADSRWKLEVGTMLVRMYIEGLA